MAPLARPPPGSALGRPPGTGAPPTVRSPQINHGQPVNRPVLRGHISPLPIVRLAANASMAALWAVVRDRLRLSLTRRPLPRIRHLRENRKRRVIRGVQSKLTRMPQRPTAQLQVPTVSNSPGVPCRH